jgi:hypothetical protein
VIIRDLNCSGTSDDLYLHHDSIRDCFRLASVLIHTARADCGAAKARCAVESRYSQKFHHWKKAQAAIFVCVLYVRARTVSAQFLV